MHTLVLVPKLALFPHTLALQNPPKYTQSVKLYRMSRNNYISDKMNLKSYLSLNIKSSSFLQVRVELLWLGQPYDAIGSLLKIWLLQYLRLNVVLMSWLNTLTLN